MNYQKYQFTGEIKKKILSDIYMGPNEVFFGSMLLNEYRFQF